MKNLFNVSEVIILLENLDDDSRSQVFDQVKQRVIHKSSICDDRVSNSLLESIFDRDAQGIGSCAFIPLVFNDNITGVMVLGSVSQERFSPGMGVNFLDKLGMLVGSYLAGRQLESSGSA